MSAWNTGKNLIILFSIILLELLFTDNVQSQSYDESMRKNITHLQCYEGIDSKMKARSCPAYSVTCSKVKMCKILCIIIVKILVSVYCRLG